jgi:hypothetical protein
MEVDRVWKEANNATISIFFNSSKGAVSSAFTYSEAIKIVIVVGMQYQSFSVSLNRWGLMMPVFVSVKTTTARRQSSETGRPLLRTGRII